MPLLTQNKELRPHLIWNWSIPALSAVLQDGTRIRTCPSAGICASVCYARNGTYLFSNVLAAHTRNLQQVIDDRIAWRDAVSAELAQDKFTRRRKMRELPIAYSAIADDWLRMWALSGRPAIRIHDAGDFFASWYLNDWLHIARQHPRLLFYAYTKEITMLRAITPPLNFRWLASTGGTQDALIGNELRHADVFPDVATMQAAGYTSQDANDLLAVLLPTNQIGITANNIKHFNKRIAGNTFSGLQHIHNSKRGKP